MHYYILFTLFQLQGVLFVSFKRIWKKKNPEMFQIVNKHIVPWGLKDILFSWVKTFSLFSEWKRVTGRGTGHSNEKNKMCRSSNTYCVLFVECWYSFILFLPRTFPFWSCVYNVKVVLFVFFSRIFSSLMLPYNFTGCYTLNEKIYAQCTLKILENALIGKKKMTANMKVLFLWVWNTITNIVAITIESINGAFVNQTIINLVVRYIGYLEKNLYT